MFLFLVFINTGTYGEIIKYLGSFGIPEVSIPMEAKNGAAIPGHTAHDDVNNMQRHSSLRMLGNDTSSDFTSILLRDEDHNNRHEEPCCIVVDRDHVDQLPLYLPRNSRTGVSLGLTESGEAIRVHDVLLGRGEPIKQHPGNCVYRALIHKYIQEYKGRQKGDKIKLTRTVLALIQKRGGRFLQKSIFSTITAGDSRKKYGHGGGPVPTMIWVPVEDSVVLRKIGQCFRFSIAAAAKRTASRQEQHPSKKGTVVVAEGSTR